MEESSRVHRLPRFMARARVVFVSLIVLLVAACSVWALWPARARNDRAWLPEFARLPQAVFEGARVRIEGVRDFRWRAGGGPAEHWDTRVYDLNSLSSVWFVLSPFDTSGWRGPAHTLLSFGFGDSVFVTVSVEARKEVGETYSIWKGLARQYELMYVIADERDVFPRRALVFGDPVYLYPARVSREKARALFVDMLERANALHGRPEFYNTVTNNCTNNLLDHVNRLVDRRIHGGWRMVLPGYSDELAHREGFLDTDLPLAEARLRFRVNDAVGACLEAPRFSACIRGGL